MRPLLAAVLLLTAAWLPMGTAPARIGASPCEYIRFIGSRFEARGLDVPPSLQAVEARLCS